MEHSPVKDAHDDTAHVPSGFFVLRTPLLSLAEWRDWSAGLQAVYALGEDNLLDEALTRDRALLRDRLQSIVARPEVQEAYFVAAPGLNERFHIWRDSPDSKRGQKIEQTLVRYFARMSARPTPFGLFAGCSAGTLGDETHLAFSHRDTAQRHTRLDADYLFALIESLGADASVRDELTYRPNSSLYQHAARIRYVRTRIEGESRSYHLAALDSTEYLRATLERAEAGAKVDELAASLVGGDITFERAHKYVGELIAAQVLVPDLALTVTGPEPIHPLIAELQKYASTRAAARALAEVRDALNDLDRGRIGASPARYHALAQSLEALPAPVEIARLFQVDMIKPASDVVLGSAVVSEMLRGVRLFQRLTREAQPGALTRFAEQFSARYEEQEVPLSEALDEESGIGLEASDEATPLLQDLSFPAQNGESDPFRSLMLSKLTRALRGSETELVLDQKDWDRFTDGGDAVPLPDAFAVQATLAAESPEALARDEFYVVWHGASGPSGGRLLGRFCHADPKLHGYLSEHLRAEEACRPEAVFAEVVHLPAGRMGNILSRPVLRDYEITYMGRSGISAERQIPVSDLLVSVRDNTIRLRSRRLGREILPRMTNAHNYQTFGLNVYRFLCLLQDQHVAQGLGWSWGAMSEAPFLPRVRTERLVLALAQWQVTKEETAEVGRLKGAALFSAVQQWRDARGLPRLVMLQEGDNVLPVDLDNVLSVESYAQLAHARGAHTLREFFPSPEHLCASGPEGLFTHELVVPFVRKPGTANPRRAGGAEETSATGARLSTLTRRFAPGGPWLYAKLYTGTATADRLLRGPVRQVVDKVGRRGAAQNWFFIRYADPDWHLRLRWHGDPTRLRSEVQPLLAEAIQPWLDNGAVRRVQFDTYEREVERYGGPVGVELSEQVFHADSDAVLEIVGMLEPGDEGLDERWRLACAGIDLLLEDFGLTLGERYEALRRARDNAAAEFKADKHFHGQLGRKFRSERGDLAALLEYREDHPLGPGVAVFRRRSTALAPVAAKLREAAGAGRLTRDLHDILESYMHMHANRLLRSAHRQQELVIYDLLTRHYDSLQASGRQKRRPRG